MVLVEAEVRAPVLVGDAGQRIDDARAEACVVALDQADRVALAVDDAEPDRAAAAGQAAAGRRHRPVRIDPRGQLLRVALVEQPRERCRVVVGIGRGEASRSAMASFDASIPRWAQRDLLGRPRPAPGRRLELLEDVEQLEGDEARAVRADGR